jgi:hypothetical protein
MGALHACTGTLLNNTSLDRKPFLLTANHCPVYDADVSTIVVYWNYQAPSCRAPHLDDTNFDFQVGGATIAARNPSSDFLLLELPSQPNGAYHVFYSGWDAGAGVPPETVTIHHPWDDEKSITLSNSPPVSKFLAPGYVELVTPPGGGTYWRVDWAAASGATEPGSSGACLFASNTKRCIGQLYGGAGSGCGTTPVDYFGRLSVSWAGEDAMSGLRHWLDPGNTGTAAITGDPHVTTVNGVGFDFQGAGEYVALRDLDGMEIQTRHEPIATTAGANPDPHDGLASCVSLVSAVAMKVGTHRVTYEPNLDGATGSSGLQLRVDGDLKVVPQGGLDLIGGGHLSNTLAPGGVEVQFPDGSLLFATPGWWAEQSRWYLNLDIARSPAIDGLESSGNGGGINPAAGGLVGIVVPGGWLPALPDGSLLVPMSGSAHDRYVDLYQRFGEAWRVTDQTSLFDNAPGVSSATFTRRDWPPESGACAIPAGVSARPESESAARQACEPVADKKAHDGCILDVMLTGNRGFAATYALSERVKTAATRTVLIDPRDRTGVGQPVKFIASVERIWQLGERPPSGQVQFMLDGKRLGEPIPLDARGRAASSPSGMKLGEHTLSAVYSGNVDGVSSSSGTPDRIHVIEDVR